MRTLANRTGQLSRTHSMRMAGAGLVMCFVMAIGSGATAQQDAQSEGAVREPHGLPPANWPTSPHRGVIDGWTGKPIPCRCRFNGKAYQLGEIVCMRTHVGTVLTRCDIFENNTSWIPSRQPCEPDAGT
jgi:hypothetical protein